MKSLKELIEKVEPAYQKEALLFSAHLYKCDLSYILAHLDKKISKTKEKELITAFKKITNDYPLAYLIGKKYFYGRPLFVNSKVLIPRPESEKIIDIGLEYARSLKKPVHFFDIGTGSGAIIISLAKEISKKNKNIYKKSRFLATDISETALKVARKNARSLRMDRKIIFKRGELINPYLQDINKSQGPIFIAANLPYLNQQERDKEISIKYEPKIALVSDSQDGLNLYKLLIKKISLLNKNISYQLLLEINPHQAEQIIFFIKKNLKLVHIKKEPDFQGQTRFVVVSKN